MKHSAVNSFQWTTYLDFFKIPFEKNKVRLLLLFFFFGIANQVVIGQTTIASESFENSLTLFSASGAGYTYYSGNSASGDRPATSPFSTLGSYGWGVNAGGSTAKTGTLTSSAINTSSFTGISLSFRLAAFSIGSTNNGLDATDIVEVFVSPDGGTNYYSTVSVTGNSSYANAFWAYSTGTATASTAYDGNATPVNFSNSATSTPAGNRTTDGHSTVTITGLPAIADLRVKISLTNNAAAELWVIDEFKVIGTLNSPCAAPLNSGTASITTTTGCASTNFTLNASGLSVGTGITYQWQSSPTGLAGSWSNINGANTATLATSAATTTYYQLLTTCSNDNSTNTTNVVSYTVTGSPCTCRTYSSNYANNTVDADITSVTVGSMTNASACGAVVGTGGVAFRYSNYTGSVTGPSEMLGSTVNFSLTSNICTSSAYNNGFQVYIDWNQDGDFLDAGEQVYSASASVSGTHTETGSFVVPLTATLGTTRMRIVNVEISFPTTTNYAQTNYSWGETEDYCFTVLAATNCSGVPNAGTATITSATGCSSTSFTLNVTGTTIGTGITYQWQSSPTGLAGTWTNISGANSPSLVTNTSVTTYYQLITTCSFSSSSSSSNVVSFTVTGSPCTCLNYPANYPSNTADEDITNVTVGSMTNASSCGALAPGAGSIAYRYSNYTGSVTGPTVMQSNSVAFSLTMTSCGGNFGNFFQIYVDWNQDGDFADAGEQVYSQSSNVVGNQTATGTFTVPATASLGTTRMRIVNNETSASTSNYGQSVSFSYGETEDYCITVTASAPCSGTPAPGNTVISSSSVLPGSTVSLSLQNQTNGSGVTYLWYSSTTSASGPWTSIPSATNATYSTTVSVPTWFYCAVTCSGNTGNSTPVGVSILYCTSTGTSSSYYINNFSTTGGQSNISNTSSGYSSGGYINTGMSVIQTPGSTINFSVSFGSLASYAFGFCIWVDWNDDYDFTDAGETLFSSGAGQSTTYTGSFTVPLTASVGCHRMRIVADYTGYPSVACNSSGISGETEDYCMTVASPCSSPSTQASNVNFTSSSASTGTVTWSSGNGNGAIVVVRASATSAVMPSNGTVYTANTAFGSGTGTAITGTGNFVVFVGSGNTVSITGLSSNTAYTATVYEYNTASQCYNLIGASAAATTPCSPFTGTYSVGSGNVAGEAGHYATLTAAVADYNTRCITGPLVFLLTDATYSTATGETFPITINSNGYASAVNTLTIKPNTGVNSTITANSSTATIIFDGADYVTIDGSNGSTVNSVCPRVQATRNLTIRNSNSNTSQNAVIWLQNIAANGSTNNTIMNCNIIGNSATTTFFGIGSADNTIQPYNVNGGRNNDNNQIINNGISNVQLGVLSVGKSTTNPNSGNVINLNDISSCRWGGILVGYETGTLISGNTITGITSTNTDDTYGIGIGLVQITSGTTTATSECTNVTISYNTLGSIVQANSSSVAGIIIGSSSSGTHTITNNMIYGIAGNTTSTDHITGMHIGGGAATYNIYHNTVLMQGTITPSSGGTISSCIAVTNTVYTLNLKNNILVNTQVNNSNNTRFTCVALAASSFTNFVSDYNNFYCAGSGSGTYQVGITGGVSTAGTMRTTIANWQTATNQDANSFNVSPVFVSTTDLHLQAVAGNTSLDNTGTPIATVTNDIDCDSRSSTPDIGADEFAISACTGTPSAGTASITVSSGCASTAFTLSATGLTVAGGISYQWQSSPTGLPGTWTNILGATSATYPTNASSTTYYQLVTTCANGGGTSTTNTVSYTVSGNPCTCLTYPANYASNTADNDLTSVSVGSMTNNSSCGDLAPGAGSIAYRYNNYTGSVTGPSANQGGSVNFSLTETLCPSGTPNQNYFLIYIDWNQDGDFADADEKVFSQIDSGPVPNVVSTQTVTGSFTVPMTASLGLTRMRVINTTGSFASFNYAQSNPYTTGEAEDYCFTVTAASGPLCPNASSIAPSGTQTICQNGTTTQLTASYTTGGLTGTPTPQYQWYSNTTNSNLISSATLIVGQTSSTFTPPSNTVGTLYYFCVVYATDNGCNQTNATQSLASNAVQVTIVDPNTAYTNSDFGTVASVSTGSTVNHLVISQLYGAGGNDYRYDYVEIFNPTNGPINFGGYTLQYQTAGQSTWAIAATIPNGTTINAGKYFLIHLDDQSNGASITADYTGTTVVNSNQAKMALSSTSTLLSSCTAGTIVDKVAWGTTNIVCNETSNATGPGNSNALFRKQNGCQDTDNNSSDFALAFPNPRNSGSPENLCAVATPTTFCGSGTPGAMSVTSVSGGTSYSYQWYYQTGLVSCPTGNSTTGWVSLGATNGANTATYTPTAAITTSTTYACFVTINGTPCSASRWANGCVQITINPTPVVTLNCGTACSGVAQQLSASVTPVGPTYTYSWSPATGLSSTTISNPTSTITTATNYTVVATNSSTGCPSAPTNCTLSIGLAPSINAISPP